MAYVISSDVMDAGCIEQLMFFSGGIYRDASRIRKMTVWNGES